MSPKNEFRGKTVEEALQHALAALGLARDQVEVEVIHEGARGLFGVGASEAVIRVTPLPPPSPLSAPTEAPAPTLAAVPAPAPAAAPRRKHDPVAHADLSRETLEILLKGMGLRARVVVKPPEPPADEKDQGEGPEFILDIQGSDLGILIGRRGETLRDLEYLTRLIVATKLNKQVRLVVDVEGYRHRRERILRELARRMADRVRLNRQPITLEAMPPHERRIVHLTLRDSTAVRTESIGEGEHRRVMILPR